MTVAHVREPDHHADHVEVLFLESARVYELTKTHPDFDTLLERLQDAMAQQQLVKVRLRSSESEVIEDIERLYPR